jgi:hypothetical protein
MIPPPLAGWLNSASTTPRDGVVAARDSSTGQCWPTGRGNQALDGKGETDHPNCLLSGQPRAEVGGQLPASLGRLQAHGQVCQIARIRACLRRHLKTEA